jgi:hypothetical protein
MSSPDSTPQKNAIAAALADELTGLNDAYSSQPSQLPPLGERGKNRPALERHERNSPSRSLTA